MPHPEIADDVSPRIDNESVLNGLMIEYRLAFPFCSSTLISVCSLLQYRVDRVKIDAYFKKKELTKPAKHGAKLQWDRERVLQLCDLLERDRCWSSNAPRHEAKKLEHEKEADAATERDIASKISGWFLCDIRTLVGEITNCEDHQTRQTAAGVLLHRLNPTESN